MEILTELNMNINNKIGTITLGVIGLILNSTYFTLLWNFSCATDFLVLTICICRYSRDKVGEVIILIGPTETNLKILSHTKEGCLWWWGMHKNWMSISTCTLLLLCFRANIQLRLRGDTYFRATVSGCLQSQVGMIMLLKAGSCLEVFSETLRIRNIELEPQLV